jgi:hypothetical protein
MLELWSAVVSIGFAAVELISVPSHMALRLLCLLCTTKHVAVISYCKEGVHMAFTCMLVCSVMSWDLRRPTLGMLLSCKSPLVWDH